MVEVGDPREAGRQAVGRGAWNEGYELLAAADELGPADLHALAEAAYWTGRLEEALEARERAYRAHLDAGDGRQAAAIALRLALDYVNRGSVPLFSGWLARGERLLEGAEESPEHGLLALCRMTEALLAGRLEESLEHARRAEELGKRFGERDLEAVGLVGQGRVLTLTGELDRGLRLLDEASAAAVSGELTPFTSCFVYCMTITSCHGLGDIERARQWTDAANRWCERQGAKGFPGACRVHRSEILRLGGDWERAEEEALSACAELESYDVFTVAGGYYQIGEIRRRRGDFAAADEAYRKAHALGRSAQPGLALLRLAQGNVNEAVAGLRRSLSEESHDPLARARRLPAQVEIALAVGDVEEAHTAADELAEVAESFQIAGKPAPLLAGSLELARGQIALAQGHWAEAEDRLRRAVSIWTGIGVPYEAAKARMLLGMAYAEEGDTAGARIEYETAKATLERLGAVLDTQRAMELLGDAKTRRTFMFTDIVNSTKLLEAIGDEKFARQLDRHDELVRRAIERAGGEVIKHTGDGFFAAFETAAEAVEAAVAAHRALDEEPISIRIGIHSGEALERGSDYAGRGVSVAARIGALAEGGQILVTRETLNGAGVAYGMTDPRVEELKGFSEPVEVVAVDWC